MSHCVFESIHRCRPFKSGAPGGAPPSAICEESGHLEGALHEARVRVAEVAVRALFECQEARFRSHELDGGENTVQTGAGEMKVVNRRLVADDEAVPPGLQLRDLLSAPSAS